MKFEWNRPETINTSVWDASANSEKLHTSFSSLKYRLAYPVGGKRIGDQLTDISKGIALIMDYVESKETK